MAGEQAAGSQAGARGGFGRRGGDRDSGRGGSRGGRGGRGARGGRGGRTGRDGGEAGDWVPITKLGRLVKDGKVKTIEEIFVASLPIREYQIVDRLIPNLKDEVMKISPVQKQTQAGQRTRFRAIIAVGDLNGHIGVGAKVSKEVATAIRGAIIAAKLAIIPIRQGYWGNVIGAPHTVPEKVSGKCGSVVVRLVPAPRGTGLVASPTSKKLLTMAGIQDCYTQTRGKTKTLGNFAMATFFAMRKTYLYLTPDMWSTKPLKAAPYQEHSDFLQKYIVKRYRQVQQQ